MYKVITTQFMIYRSFYYTYLSYPYILILYIYTDYNGLLTIQGPINTPSLVPFWYNACHELEGIKNSHFVNFTIYTVKIFTLT